MADTAKQYPLDDYPTRLEDERWLERKDPVVWGKWSPQSPLTKAQTDSFEKNGYLVMDNVFSDEEVAVLKEESAQMRSPGANLIEGSVISEPESDEVRTVFQLERQSEIFDRLARDMRIAGAVSFLLDDDVYFHQSRLNYKPGFT
ncbi:MAG: ectoine hydroxylase, partial [Rhodobiaceae bacterium]|nr:ectoine hydroxylase [Rhodobiaceae bacterium]